jgi:hypothetical protein
MPDDGVNIEQRIKTYLLNMCVITENAKLRKHNATSIYVNWPYTNSNFMQL